MPQGVFKSIRCSLAIVKLALIYALKSEMKRTRKTPNNSRLLSRHTHTQTDTNEMFSSS